MPLKKNSVCPNQSSRPLFRESVKRRTLSETEAAEGHLAARPSLTRFSRARMLHFKREWLSFQPRNETQNSHHWPALALTSRSQRVDPEADEPTLRNSALDSGQGRT